MEINLGRGGKQFEKQLRRLDTFRPMGIDLPFFELSWTSSNMLTSKRKNVQMETKKSWQIA